MTGPLLAQVQQEEKETKVYEVKWRNVQDLEFMLTPFIDEARHVIANPSFRTITVIAAPPVQAVIAQLIRKYDQPRRQVEFQFYLLRGYRVGEGVKDGVPEPVRAVLRDVSSLTTFKAFDLLDSPVVRAMEGGEVVVDSAGELVGRIGMSAPVVIAPESGKAEIRIDQFSLTYEAASRPETKKEGQTTVSFQFRPVRLQTAFSIKDGETIVIGSSRVQEAGKAGGDAIVAVVSARLLSRSEANPQ